MHSTLARALRDDIAAILQVFKVENAIAADSPYSRLNLSDLSVLLFLGEVGEATPMSRIAAHLRCQPSTAGAIADRLVAAGLVARERPESDRRTVLVSLTAEGGALQAQVVAAQVADCEAMLAALDSKKDRRRLVDLLGAVARAVRDKA